MQHVKTANSAQDLLAERLGGPKNPRNIKDPTDRASRRGTDILKELTNYFKTENITTKRLAIEEQAAEISKPQNSWICLRQKSSWEATRQRLMNDWNERGARNCERDCESLLTGSEQNNQKNQYRESSLPLAAAASRRARSYLPFVAGSCKVPLSTQPQATVAVCSYKAAPVEYCPKNLQTSVASARFNDFFWYI